MVSDLHLSSESALDDFHSDASFADFLRYYAARHPRIHLIIAGDFVDFLQIDPAPPPPQFAARRDELDQIFPLRITEAQAVSGLERTIARHILFFEALRMFVATPAPARRLSILRGNHDAEFAWPRVRERLRQELGNPDEQTLEFLPEGIFIEEQATYIEHGQQYDNWNTFRCPQDPFTDSHRRRLELPFGSVLVKTFWNRIERDFPHIDKIRPMADSVAALLVQRPTYLLLKFDYVIDLIAAIFGSRIAARLGRRPRHGTPPAPPPGSPGAHARTLWRHRGLGMLTTMLVVAMTSFLVFRGALLWELRPRLGLSRVLHVVAALFSRFALHIAIAFAIIFAARLLRRLLVRYDIWPGSRPLLFRFATLAAALIFLEAVGRMFWIPIALALAAYIIWDAARTIDGAVIVERDPLLRRPLPPDLEAAIRLLRLPRVRTVVLGHTHQAHEVEVADGRRYINSGTWVKIVDTRNIRSEPTEHSTYVAVESGEARLMTWRGTTPARPHGTGAAELASVSAAERPAQSSP